MRLWFASVAIAGMLVGLFWVADQHKPKPQTLYCSTGAGPTVIEGFDVHERINPFMPDVHEVVWRREVHGTALSSAALQPPVSCRPL